MIRATVSSRSCFSWLYRASPSLAAKNIISLISVLTIWLGPCVESSLVLFEEGVCHDQHILLGKTLLAFSLLHSIFQGQIFPATPGVSWLPTSAFQSPIIKGHLFGVLVLKGLVNLHRLVQLLQHYWLGHRLGLPWYWMVCLGNKQRSFYHFWDGIHVLHLRLMLPMMATPFLLRDSCPQ